MHSTIGAGEVAANDFGLAPREGKKDPRQMERWL
jgi:hypothetical protein